MRIIVLFIFSFFLNEIYCQHRGGEVETTTSRSSGKTYAFIVGVSKYKNPKIPDLKYADIDALMFKEYLISAGVPQSNIYTLINEQATNASFWSTLNFISEQLEENDRFYIYFSGHGDVENKTIVQDAYLLPYDSPYTVYPMGAIGIVYLKSWIATFSSKGVQTIFVADACRSGNLIGGREGMEATANILKDKWEDEIKIVSCQPGELSLEGEQWGGGRGLFSFELLNGLSGFADKNKDGQVSLRELNLYLLEKVPEQAGRSPQNPMLYGNFESTISEVNKDFQQSLTENQNLSKIINQGILDAEKNLVSAKGFETVLQSKDDAAESKFNEILENIAENRIISFYGPNAYTNYNELKRTFPNEPKLLETAKLLITEKVLKNVQNFVLFVLGEIKESEFNPKEIGAVSFQATVLREIVGDDKLIESGNFSRILFAEACRSLKTFVIENDFIMPKEVAMAKIDTAISYEKGAVYLNCLKGLILEFEYGNKESALVEYTKAVEINPNFRIARNMLLRRLLEQENYRSILSYTNAKNLSHLDDLYSYIAYKRLNIPDSAELYYARVLSFSHSPLYPLKEFEKNVEIGAFLLDTKEVEKAKIFFEKALKSVDRALSDTSENVWRIMDDLPVIHYNLACCHALMNNTEQAIINLNSAMNNGWSDYEWMMTDPDLSEIRKSKLFSKMLNENSRYCYNKACKLSLDGNLKDSKKYLEYALKAGFRDFDWAMQDEDLFNLRVAVDLNKLFETYKSN